MWRNAKSSRWNWPRWVATQVPICIWPCTKNVVEWKIRWSLVPLYSRVFPKLNNASQYWRSHACNNLRNINISLWEVTILQWIISWFRWSRTPCSNDDLSLQAFANWRSSFHSDESRKFYCLSILYLFLPLRLGQVWIWKPCWWYWTYVYHLRPDKTNWSLCLSTQLGWEHCLGRWRSWDGWITSCYLQRTRNSCNLPFRRSSVVCWCNLRRLWLRSNVGPLKDTWNYFPVGISFRRQNLHFPWLERYQLADLNLLMG